MAIERIAMMPAELLAWNFQQPEHNGHPEGWPFAVSVNDGRSFGAYRSFLRQLIRSPRVVVELETGALWACSL